MKFSTKEQLLKYLYTISKDYPNNQIPNKDLNLDDVGKELFKKLHHDKYISGAQSVGKLYEYQGIKIFDLRSKATVITPKGKLYLHDLNKKHRTTVFKMLVTGILIPLTVWGIEVLLKSWLSH